MRLTAVLLATVLLTSASVNSARAQTSHQELQQLVERHSADYIKTSKAIWDYAELGYHEEKSSGLLQSDLKQAGFTIQTGLADEPTSFIASYGTGKPVIGILGEFDALPGLSHRLGARSQSGDSRRARPWMRPQSAWIRSRAGRGGAQRLHGNSPCGGHDPLLRHAGRRGRGREGLPGAVGRF